MTTAFKPTKFGYSVGNERVVFQAGDANGRVIVHFQEKSPVKRNSHSFRLTAFKAKQLMKWLERYAEYEQTIKRAYPPRRRG